MPSVIRGNDNFDSANFGPNATTGAVGTYGFFTCSASGTLSAGSTVSGSTLTYASVSGGGVNSSGTPSGTWKLMGYRGASTTVTSVYFRIS